MISTRNSIQRSTSISWLKKLGCPVIKTVSTDHKGLQDVVKAAVSENGKGQKAPYMQAEINLHDKEAVDAEDRKRFAFVNKIVSEVETA